jgi:hypothetical protein
MSNAHFGTKVIRQLKKVESERRHYENRRWRARRQRTRVDLDQAARDAHAVSRKLLRERRRRAAILQSVLIAVPGTCDAPVDDAPLPDWPVLVGAEIRQRADPGPVAKHRNALATGHCNDAGTLVWDRKRCSDRKPSVIPRPIAEVTCALAPPGNEVQYRHAEKSPGQHPRNDRVAVVLHDAERHMHHHQPVGEVERHVQALPNRRR